MVPAVRKAYNAAFTPQRYQHFLQEMNNAHPGDIEFRIAETPVFLSKEFKHKLLQACESIVDTILRPDFIALTEPSLPPQVRVPDEKEYCDFLTFDFGVCQNEAGEYEPQLIEMQGFPTMFAYQVMQADVTRRNFPIPANYDNYFDGITREQYIALLKDIILNGHAAENVILLEIHPEKQKTRIDFKCTQDFTGIEIVCITQLKADGKQLYYEKDGRRIDIKRIYNRVIFDELDKEELPAGTLDIRDGWNVEWCPHPNWFYRVSKFTLPFINSPYAPFTQFVDKLERIPDDLENYVLKPLFSFAGQGVLIDVSRADIESLPDPHNWILQKKVNYAAAVETPNEPAKAEIRIFYFWKKGAPRPIPVHSLARLSKGKMIGVRYNADKEWVGGSMCFFEKG